MNKFEQIMSQYSPFEKMKEVEEHLPSEMVKYWIDKFYDFITEFEPFINEQNQQIRHSVKHTIFAFNSALMEIQTNYSNTIYDLKKKNPRIIEIESIKFDLYFLYYMEDLFSFVAQIVDYLYLLYCDMQR